MESFKCQYCGEKKEYKPMVDNGYYRSLWRGYVAAKSCVDCEYVLGIDKHGRTHGDQLIKIIEYKAKEIAAKMISGNHQRHHGKC